MYSTEFMKYVLKYQSEDFKPKEENEKKKETKTDFMSLIPKNPVRVSVQNGTK